MPSPPRSRKAPSTKSALAAFLHWRRSGAVARLKPMVSGAKGRRRGWLLAAAACGLSAASAAHAQQAPAGPAELDPNAPLDPMPDLGVEWPDMDKPDPAPEPSAAAEASAENQAIEDSGAARRYAYRVDGL